MSSQERNSINENEIKSSWPKLDSMTRGLIRGNLILVASRPSIGKTSFALSIICRSFIPKKMRVVLFSLEMAKEDLSKRMLSMLSSVDLERLSAAELKEHHWTDLQNAAAILSKSEIFIDDTAPLSPSQISERCHEIEKKNGKIDLVVVDYLQLLTVEEKSISAPREAILYEISRKIKKTAKDLDCPIVLLCQLSRKVEKISARDLNLSDLREQGPIEQNADVVIFLTRSREEIAEHSFGKIKLIVAKSRAGDCGPIELNIKASKAGLFFGDEV